MEKNKPALTYEKTEINETAYVCSDCITSAGNLSQVYLCGYGVFIVLDNLKYPIRETYQKVKEIFNTKYIYIFIPQAGLYDYYSKKFIEDNKEKDGYEAYIHWYSKFAVSQAEDRYTYEDLLRIESRLKLDDANTRGSYIDSEGIAYLKKGDTFAKVSDIDSDSVFRSCVYFGFLGIHRFKTKKYMSGLWYILSFGLVGMGPVLDLILLLLGIYYDKRKAILLPVTDKKNKLKLIPVCIFINAVYVFSIYFIISKLM